MRDTVASRRFRAEAALRRWLHARLPQRFATLYELVTFSRTPYAAAVARIEHQDRTVRRVALGALVLVVAALVLVLGALLWN